MHCIILAGEVSTCLYPATKVFPNALLPIRGRALVDFVCEDIRNQKEVVATTVVTNALYFPLLKKHFANAFPEDKVMILNNGVSSGREQVGAVNDLLFAIQSQKLQDEDLLVVASDIYTSLKAQDFIRFFKQFKGITMAVFDEHGKKKTGDTGWVEVQKNKVVKFAKNPEDLSRALSVIPYYLFPKTSLPLFLEFQKTSEEKSFNFFVSWALAHAPVYAHNMGTGRNFNINTIDLYREAKAKI